MNDMIDELKKQEIIDKIIRSRPYSLSISRKERFLRAPFKTLLFYFRVFINQYSPARFKIKAKNIFGDEMCGYSSGSIGSVYYLGFQDPELTIFLIKYLKTGDVFFDVGANVGYYSLLAENLVGGSGRIYSFEPTPMTYAVLKENTKKFPNIYNFQIALADETGAMEFIDYGPRYSVFNSFSNRNLEFLSKRAKTIKIPTETLDNFCRKENVAPTIIKLDAEGAEGLILSAGKETLKKHRPIALLEVGGGEEWKENNLRAIKFLSDELYRVFELDASGDILSHQVKEIYSYNNLVFIPEEKVGYFFKKT